MRFFRIDPIQSILVIPTILLLTLWCAYPGGTIAELAASISASSGAG